MDVIGGKDLCGDPGKIRTVVAAVVSDGCLDFPGKVLFHIICQPLGGHSDSIPVHPVCANSHDPS